MVTFAGFEGCWGAFRDEDVLRVLGHFKGWFRRFWDLGVLWGYWERFKGVLGAFGRWCLKRIIKQSLQDLWIWVKI